MGGKKHTATQTQPSGPGAGQGDGYPAAVPGAGQGDGYQAADEWWRSAAGWLAAGWLGVLGSVAVARAGWAVVQPVGLDYAEPVVYGQALRVVAGQALYLAIDQAPYTVAAYTPLYYWVAAALQVMVGPGWWPGRLLSLLAGVATAVMVAVLAGHRDGGRQGTRDGRRDDGCQGVSEARSERWWAGVLAGLLFLGLAFGGQVPWLGLYRVDVLGVALSVAAIGVLAGRDGLRNTVAAGVLAGLALLTKQTFLAALVAGTLWLIPDRRQQVQDRRQSAVVFCGVGLATFGLPCLVLEATTGGAFLQNTLQANVNPFAAAIAAGLLPIFLGSQWLPLLLAGVYLAVGQPWRRRESRLLVLYWLTSSVWLLGIAKVGANTNYWIEFAAATAILAGRGAARLLRPSRRLPALAGAAALLIAVGVQIGGPSGLLAALKNVRADVAATRTVPPHADFDALVERVRYAAGGVLAEPMDVLVLADRPVLLEPFIYNLLLSAGQWQPGPLVARICSGQIGLLVLAYPLDVGAHMTDGLYALWPAPVMDALQASMALDTIQADRYVYTYAPSESPGSACT